VNKQVLIFFSFAFVLVILSLGLFAVIKFSAPTQAIEDDSISTENSNECLSATNTLIQSGRLECAINETIKGIYDRVIWIDENRNYFYHSDDGNYLDYFYDCRLVLRVGSEYSAELEGAIIYFLYYDEFENLVFAWIMQYRNSFYNIFFQCNEVLRLISGDVTNEPATVFDELMLNAIRLSLENANRVGS
jgi:hypothetical protein